MSLAAVLSRLGATADVSGRVGGRIFAEVAPQGEAMPHIVLRQSGRAFERTLDGSSGPVDTRVVVQVFAHTFAEVDAIATAIEDAFQVPFPASGNIAFMLDGVNVSDFVPATSAYRRAIEVRVHG